MFPTPEKTAVETAQRESEEAALVDALQKFQTESGRALLELIDESPVLLIFLRHFGCSFCRETLEQVAGVEQQLQSRGVRPVFVHLGTPERARPYFDYYRLSHVERVSNPDGSLYAHPAFHLPRVHFLLHFLVPSNWKRWLAHSIFQHGIGMIQEDAHQMPGVFFLRGRRIVRSFRYRTISDQPKYLKLIA